MQTKRIPVQKSQAADKWTIYYDGQCRLCTRLVLLLSRLDLSNRVAWVPFQSLDTPPPGLSWQDLERSAYLRTGKGRLYEGFYAFRMLTLRLIPFLPLAPILWLPGIDIFGVAVYRWVARNRSRISSLLFPPTHHIV